MANCGRYQMTQSVYPSGYNSPLRQGEKQRASDYEPVS